MPTFFGALSYKYTGFPTHSFALWLGWRLVTARWSTGRARYFQNAVNSEKELSFYSLYRFIFVCFFKQEKQNFYLKKYYGFPILLQYIFSRNGYGKQPLTRFDNQNRRINTFSKMQDRTEKIS